MIIDVYISGANGSHPNLWFEKKYLYLCGCLKISYPYTVSLWSMKIFHKLAMLGGVRIHRIAVGLHLLGELALGRRGVTACTRFKRIVGRFQRKSLGKSEFGGLVVGDGMVYSFLRGQSYRIPIVGWFF